MWIFLIFSYLSIPLIFASDLCPSTCVCDNYFVKCPQQHLLHFPKWLPKDVTNIDFSGNELSLIDNDTFIEFTNLVELNLSDNQFKDIRSLGKLPKSLKVLHLSRNKLNSVNGVWNQFVKLDFSGNDIVKIEDNTFVGAHNLEELILSNNNIKSISPKAMADMKKLRILKLDGNNLTVLPPIHCKSVHTLDLTGNKLKKIGTLAIGKIVPSIETLILSDNEIMSLADAALSSVNLKYLYLNGNMLKSIDGKWMFGLNALEHLNLENNMIVNISSSSWRTNCCNNLKVLNLAHNKLGQILFENHKSKGANLANLGSLVSLNLSSNEISHISDGSFNSMKSLKTLDLNSNKLSLVKKSTFKELWKLEKLFLYQNPFVDFSEDAFSSFEHLSYLHLSSDVVHCGCKILGFVKWLKTSSFVHSTHLKCGQPIKLAGSDLTKISYKDLKCDTTRPVITNDPQSQIALAGDEVRLSCTVKNGSMRAIRILWQKDSKNVNLMESKVIVYTQTEAKFVYYTSVLYLYNVSDVKDAGRYQCLIFVGNERLESLIADVHVFIPPKFTSTPGNLIVPPGYDVYLNISASGDPQPTISYRKEEMSRFLAARERRLDVKDAIFVIKNVSHRDAGRYICFAKNEVGIINETFTLNVIGAPIAQSEMLDKVALVNDSVVFVCSVRGWRSLQFTWLKDGKIINVTSSRNMQVQLTNNGQNLLLSQIKINDAGIYKCRVSNELGAVELKSYLKVVKDFAEERGASEGENVSNRTLLGAVIFTAALTMVFTILISVAVMYIINRRRYTTLKRCERSDAATLQSHPIADSPTQHYIPITDAYSNDSSRTSSTYAGSSDTQTQSELTSCSDSSWNKELCNGSQDGQNSSGVCSINSGSNSSLSSTLNHRNTFPFSNVKTFLCPGTGDELYERTNNHELICSPEQLQQKQLLHFKINEKYSPSRRKHCSSSRGKPPRSRAKGFPRSREEEKVKISQYKHAKNLKTDLKISNDTVL